MSFYSIYCLAEGERRTVGTSFDKETQMMTLYNLSCIYKADRKVHTQVLSLLND